LKRWRSLVVRHQASVIDLALIAAAMGVCIFLAWEFDIYPQAPSALLHDKVIDLDETLTLFGILALLMLVFSIRRYAEQRRETMRRVAAENQVRVLAYEDALTGLPNRRRFDQALAAAIAAPPSADATHAVFMLDLNGFKQINDIHGHGVGDKVLAIVAQRLVGAVRTVDMVSRFGGDEFAILATHLDGPAAATNIALRVIDALRQPIQTGAIRHHVGTGIGIALVPKDATDAEEALRRADVALYRAKGEHTSSARFFEVEMDRYILGRAQMVEDLRTAMASGDIWPQFYPIVDLRTDAVVAFEAVPSWQHPALGAIPADRFMPLADESGMLPGLADRLLTLACQAALEWPADVTLSIDLFYGQVDDETIASRVAAILRATGLSAGRLELELAESVLVRDLAAAQILLSQLHAIGVRVALDQFGTGYSSLYHLLNVKVDRVKIDRGLVEAMGSHGDGQRIVNALVGLSLGLGLIVSADGVRDEAQQAILLRHGCVQGQGLAFSRAISAGETTALFGAAPGVAASTAPARS
jgi:diguanylate cyclase (GGDEF)-like protein